MRSRWSEYFERLQNMFYDRLADVGCLGRNGMGSERVKESGLVKKEEVVR